jgi:predicted transposase YbfD/YdcC
MAKTKNKIKDVLFVFTEAMKEIHIVDKSRIDAKSVLRFINIFENVEDFRKPRKGIYKLAHLLTMILFSVIEEGNHSSCVGIEDYIAIRKEEFKEWGLLEDDRTPSHDTIRLVLMSIKPASLQKCLIDSLSVFFDILRKNTDGVEHNSVDGKEIKGSGRSASTRNPSRNINVLNLYSNSMGICVHSVNVKDKTNEIPVAQEVLENIKLRGTITTFDALHTQKETCSLIHKAGGYFAAPIKKNQKSLLAEAEARISKKPEKNEIIKTEKRTFEFVKLPNNYASEEYGKIRCYIKMTSHTRSKPLVMYFMSNSNDKELIVEGIEYRWEIENDLHKLKDEILHEDDRHITNRTAVNNIAIINNFALAVIKFYFAAAHDDSLHRAKRRFKMYPKECFLSILEMMSDDEIIKEIKKNLRKL